MNRSHILFHHVASAPGGIDVMMAEEDTTSRDSGVSMTMDENTPVCFSSLSAEMQSRMAVESMDVDDVVPKRSSKGTPFRRQNSCNKGLFNETCTTPKISRDSTGSLTVRSSNQDNGTRKRSMADCGGGGDDEEYQQKRERSSDHYHLEPTGESAEDDIETIEQQLENDEVTVEPMFEDYPLGQESTSAAFTAFTLPVQKRKAATGSLVHHHTVPNVRLDDDDEDIDEHHLCVRYQLPTTESNCSTSFRRIGTRTMINVLTSMTDAEFNNKFILIDCRYPFEYEAGHIKHAINFFKPQFVFDVFYSTAHEKLHDKIPIFYCEFSQKRGPSMANALRKLDRHLNLHHYPRCSFEEMYVLDKGYREFHRLTTLTKKTNLCQPRHEYVEMNDQRFSEQLRQYHQHKRLPNATAKIFVEESSRFALGSGGTHPATIARVLPDGSPEEEQEPENPTQRQQRLQAAQQADVGNRRTPQIPRQKSQRALTFDAQDSPTNFNRPTPRPDNSPDSPSPQKPTPHLVLN